MTYNFDPDKWLDDEIYMLKAKFQNGQVTQKQYEVQIQQLEDRHDEMWKRLDGTYQISKGTS